MALVCRGSAHFSRTWEFNGLGTIAWLGEHVLERREDF